MGIFFTLLYIFTTYLAPSTVFGSLADFHIEQIIAAVVLIVSLFGAAGSGLLKMPQTYGVLAMAACVAFSLAFNGVWFLMPSMLISFLTGSIAFFFVLWNFRTLFHLRLLIATLLLVALITVYQGATAVYHADATSPWVFMMGYGDGPKFFRIRGMGFINDPNDLCQFLVGLIPCVFIFWRRGQFLLNTLFVLVPVAVLGYGMFLTHSRGGMVGLLVALIVMGRRKFGILPALITGGAFFAVLSAIGWSGGRDINAESGGDRMEAWSTGLGLIRSHPLFGVGYLRFTEYFYITAHNTIVVCAAEIGLIGLFFWMLMAVPTFYDLIVAARQPVLNPGVDKNKISRPGGSLAKAVGLKPAPLQLAALSSPVLRMAFAAPPAPVIAPEVGFASPTATVRPVRGVLSLGNASTGSPTDEELRRICGLMVGGLSGFFAAGWFLSRSYTMVLFVNIALAMAVHRLAVDRGIAPARLALSKAAKYAGIATVVMVAVVYFMLRITNLLPK